MLNRPESVAVDSTGSVYIADTRNSRIRRVASGIIATFAGNGGFKYSGDGGPGIDASLNFPISVAADSAGGLFISDGDNYRVRKLAGTVPTVAGNGVPPATLYPVAVFSGNGGSATSAAIAPNGIAGDSSDNLFIADLAYFRIFKVSQTGVITVIAGTGAFATFSGDGGPATAANLYGPSAAAVNARGDIFVVDWPAHRIREISGGLITTVAGTAPVSLILGGGFSGDGGPATSALLRTPEGVAIAPNGDLFIADTGNNRIRKVSNGIITTVAGNGVAGFSGDGGTATSAALNNPWAVVVDSSGNLFITDTGNNRIRKVSNGIITTVAGNGVSGFSGDGGPATSATLNRPQGVAIDSAGNLIIADTGNSRIREVLSMSPSFQISATTLNFSVTSGGVAPATQAISLTPSLAGLGFVANPSTTWLNVSPSSGAMPSTLQVSVDPSQLSPGTYNGSITVAAANAPVQTVAVNVTVTPPNPGKLGVSAPSVSFSVTQGSAATNSQLSLTNTGGGPVSFTASATGQAGFRFRPQAEP